jgi:hypothetical protein
MNRLGDIQGFKVRPPVGRADSWGHSHPANSDFFSKRNHVSLINLSGSDGS